MRRVGVLGAAMLLGGCTVSAGVEPATSPVPLDGQYGNAETRSVLPGAPDPQLLARWWRTLGDPTLDALVDDALARNLDLAVARARIRQARANRRIARADALPTLDATGVAQRSRISENIGLGGGSSGSGGQGGGAAGGGQSGGGQSGGGQAGGGQAGGGAAGGQGGAGAGLPGGFSGLPGSEIDFFQASFDASWEVDLFGGVRSAVRAADARIAAAELSLADVRTTLIAEIVREYVTVRELQTRLTVVRANLAAARRTAAITRERERAGLVTELDPLRADAAVLALEALVPQYDVQLAQAGQRLAVLAAREPTALRATLAIARPLPVVPERAAIGLPSELLRRRPDIRAAERRVAAAAREADVAVADIYPRLTFSASAGTQASRIADLADWGSRFYRLAANLVAPVIDGGRRRATLELRRAEAEEALANYRIAVLGAFQDVEDALVAYARDRDRLAVNRVEADKRRRAVAIAREQYRAGLVNLLDVLQAERDLFSAEEQVATASGTLAADWAALQKALGGGWEPSTGPDGETRR